MKKLALLLFTLIALKSLSYASFPIYDPLQIAEVKQYYYCLPKTGVYINSFKCENFQNSLAPLLSKPKPLTPRVKNTNEVETRELNGNWYALLSILSALGAIIFAFLTLGSGMMHNADPSIVITYLLLTLLTIGGTVFSALKAKKSGASWSKALLGVGILVLLVSFF